MTFMTIYLSVFTLLFACWSQTNKQSDEIPYDKLSIPKHWTELTKQNNEWVYLIPCNDIRELQTIDILIKGNSKAIEWNNGLDGQWYTMSRPKIGLHKKV